MSSFNHLYNRLYRLFDCKTPIKADCGKICDCACCKGNDNTGMILFPGETTTLDVKEANGRRYAICGGKCDRAERPLSCRIFPFFPVVDSNGEIAVTIDPRGFNICPLVRNAPDVAFNSSFIRRVYVAGKMLSRNKECFEYLKDITAEINDTFVFLDKMEGSK